MRSDVIMNKIKVVINENKTLLNEGSPIRFEELRMWLDQAIEGPETLLNPETGEIALKDKRGIIRLDPKGNPYTDISGLSDDFVSPRKAGQRARAGGGLTDADIIWFNSADEFVAEADRIHGKFGPKDPVTFKQRYADLSKRIKRKLSTGWRTIKGKIKYKFSMTKAGRERRKYMGAKARARAGAQDLVLPHKPIHTEEDIRKIIENLDDEIKTLSSSPGEAADALPDVEDQWGKKTKPKKIKKAQRFKIMRERRVKQLQLYRDLLQNNLDVHGDLTLGIKVGTKDVPAIQTLAPGPRRAKLRKLAYKLRPGRFAAKVPFIGTAAAIYMYYDLIEEILRMGANSSHVSRIIGWWTAAHMESMDTAPHISFNNNVDAVIKEVDTRYKLAWFRHAPPAGLKKIAKEKGIPFQKATKEDMRIINSSDFVRKGVLASIMDRLTKGMGGSAFNDPYESPPEQQKPGAIPVHPKDPGYFSPARGTGKFEESKNYQRSKNKLKIKINS